MNFYSHWFKAKNALITLLGRFMLGRLLLAASFKPAQGPIRVVCATRHNEASFWEHSALGKSLLGSPGQEQLIFDICFENRLGLPSVYNSAIKRAKPDELLLFVHDDVWLDDLDWANALRHGLGTYDVIGVAGNRRLTAIQPAWLFKVLTVRGFEWDTPYLSGAVGHGQHPKGEVQTYGPTPSRCKALDGVLLATSAAVLGLTGLSFDERFRFHFYDLDFCRAAENAGIRMGTWPIAITHQSVGAFGCLDWRIGYQSYLFKWK